MFFGSFVNAAVIVLGSAIGLIIKFPEGVRITITQALGLCSMIIGIKMGLVHENILIPIASLVIGGFIGESLKIETKIAGLGKLFGRNKSESDAGRISQGFMTATLVFCVGAMSVIGSLEAGLQGNHDTLLAKSMLDGVSAIFFSSTFGIGVMFSALSVLVYQGIITLGASFLEPLLHPVALAELTATGGILILAIGLNILGVTKIPVGNLLPAIIISVLLCMV